MDELEFDILETCAFIKSGSHAIVALQFPDELLTAAARVSRLIQQHLCSYQCKLFVLADSAYNPLGTDEVAAKHGRADCIIHYGFASLVVPSSLPAFFVFPKAPVLFPPLSDSEAIRSDLIELRAKSLSRQLVEEILTTFPDDQATDILILLDQSYEHARPTLVKAVQEVVTDQGPSNRSIRFTEPPQRHLVPGSQAPSLNHQVQSSSGSKEARVWLGPMESPALQAAQLKEGSKSTRWLCCNAEAEGSSVRLVVNKGTVEATRTLLKRRYYLVEKAKQANIVGILVGTLSSQDFREIISLIRRLARQAGKKTYTITVGKPNPAKLANFPELEVFVMVADPLGFLFDSKPFLAPIISPAEAALAFTGRSLDLEAPYSFDFKELLEEAAANNFWAPQLQEEEGEAIEEGALVQMTESFSTGSSLVPRSKNEMAVHNAAEYLNLKRGYKGLETPLTGAAVLEPSEAVMGRSGRAACYQEEGNC
jgi:diphthamide biosynthesis protein 2